MSLSTKKMNSSFHQKNNKNLSNNSNIPNGKYLFASSFHQTKKPNNIHTVSNNKNLQKSTTSNEVKSQNIVNKNSMRQNKYSDIYEIKNNVVFQNYFRSSSTSCQKISTEGNIKHSSNIHKNQNVKKSSEYNNNMINTFKNNNNNKHKKNNRNNSNSIKRSIKFNLNNLCNFEDYKNLFSNATKRKKSSPSYPKPQAPLQTEYKKNGNFSDNKSNNNMFLSHNQICTLGNLFTNDNSIYNNTDNNVINKKNYRNDIMKKYYNSKIYKDINAINFPDFQLPVKPLVSPNNIIQIQNYLNNLYNKSHTNKNSNNYISSESNKINKSKKRKSKPPKKNNNTNNVNEADSEIKNSVSNYANKNNKILKKDLQNEKEINHSNANNINEDNEINGKNENEDKYDGPEEMHLYYVEAIQKGKQIEKKTCH